MDKLTDRAKHRLRIAARFMRQKGSQFDGGNFYDLVIKSIAQLDIAPQEHLRELVEWIEGYEIAERHTYGEPQRSRLRKCKPKLGMRLGSVSDAKPR